MKPIKKTEKKEEVKEAVAEIVKEKTPDEAWKENLETRLEELYSHYEWMLKNNFHSLSNLEVEIEQTKAQISKLNA